MKIVNKIILSAVAAAALVFATACSNDYTVAEYEAGAKKVLNQAEIIEAILASQGGSSLGDSIAANVVFDFTAEANVPAALVTDSDSTAVTNVAVTATSGTEATLSVSGNYKTKKTEADGGAYLGYIQSKATSSVTIDDFASETKVMTLTLSGAAKIEVVCAGAGTADPKRYVVLADSSNKKLDGKGSLGNETDETVTAKVPAGTYKIFNNGARIKTITCKVIE